MPTHNMNDQVDYFICHASEDSYQRAETLLRQMNSNRRPSRILLIAAAYNIVWGASVVLFPQWFFMFGRMEPPRYPEIWQCVGMIVGVYGLGYGIAAWDPVRHWPIILVGLLGKILGPIGFVFALVEGTFTARAGLTILTNDLVWWVPFTWLLWQAWKANRADGVNSEVGT